MVLFFGYFFEQAKNVIRTFLGDFNLFLIFVKNKTKFKHRLISLKCLILFIIGSTKIKICPPTEKFFFIAHFSKLRLVGAFFCFCLKVLVLSDKFKWRQPIKYNFFILLKTISRQRKNLFIKWVRKN